MRRKPKTSGADLESAAQDGSTHAAPANGSTRGGEAVAILAIGNDEADGEVLRGMLPDPNWAVLKSHGCAEAFRRLSHRAVQLVVCDCDLPDGSWRNVLDYCHGLRRPPLVIVASRNADEVLWAEVLDMGGQDVLAKPFHRDEVLCALRLAWLSWVNPPESGQPLSLAPWTGLHAAGTTAGE